MLEEMIRVGRIAPVNACEIAHSRIGVGMEKLDRDAFDPTPVYDHVAALGVKWIRIQSGWAKTERIPGEYDFAWLDDIVDNLLKRSLRPWMCLCYGNGLYTPEAVGYLGAAGFPPLSEVASKAWLNYVRATITHFKGRVFDYEIWNEPDGTCWRHGANAVEYGEFAIKTAKVIRETDADAQIIVGSIYTRDMQYPDDFLAAGLYEYADALTFHEYTYDERYIIHRIQATRALLDSYKPGIKIIQGESGSQSHSHGFGALNWIATNEQMQAKHLSRHFMADLIGNVDFTSYFSSVDMVECLTGGKIGGSDNKDPGYFGLLRLKKDGTYTPKQSYYTMQTIAAIFNNCSPVALPMLLTPKQSPAIDGYDTTDATLVFSGFQKENGSSALVYWNSLDMLKVKDYEATISFQIVSKESNPHLVDILDGSIYALDKKQCVKHGNTYTFTNIPVKDYPLLIAFEGFVNY